MNGLNYQLILVLVHMVKFISFYNFHRQSKWMILSRKKTNQRIWIYRSRFFFFHIILNFRFQVFSSYLLTWNRINRFKKGFVEYMLMKVEKRKPMKDRMELINSVNNVNINEIVIWYREFFFSNVNAFINAPLISKWISHRTPTSYSFALYTLMVINIIFWGCILFMAVWCLGVTVIEVRNLKTKDKFGKMRLVQRRSI